MSTGLTFDIPSRDLLVQAAWGDFVHDFDDPIRAVVTVGILNQVPIEQTQSIKNAYGTLVNLIGQASGNKKNVTAFQMFRGLFPQTMPAKGETIPTQVLHEDDITKLSGIPYAQIMKTLSTKGFEKVPETPMTLSGHNYNVSAIPEKDKGVHAHMVSCLNNLTGALNFVIMWDAGSCEISEIGSIFEANKVIPNFNLNQQYNVFFINSKENLSDPAPKPTASTLATKNPNVNIYFLEEDDENSTTIYPIYPGDLKDQNANLFSGYKLVTARGKGKTVSGTLFTGSTPPVVVNVEDIKEASKVNSAVANAVIAKLTNRPEQEQMAYFFLKRAGDWCQALTLLDKNRKYKATPAKGNQPNGTIDNQIKSLSELEGNAPILLITNDRVLLSYGILLGLNVIFTNVRNAKNWLLYFRNMDAGKVDDAQEVMKKGNENIEEIELFLGDLKQYIQTQQTIIANSIAKLNTIQAYTEQNGWKVFAEIRDAAYKLARLPSVADMENTKNIIVTSLQILQQGIDPNTLGKLRSANGSYESAESIFSSLQDSKYPDIQKDVNMLEAIRQKIVTGNTLSSASDLYIQYQNLIDMIKKDKEKTNLIEITPLQNIDTVLRNAGVNLAQIRASRTTPASSVDGFLRNYFNRQFGFQQGGKHKKLRLRGGVSDLFNAYVENHIVPYISNAKTIVQYTLKTADSAHSIDNEYFIAKNGNYIRLLNGRYESVIDGFIETGFNYESYRDIILEVENEVNIQNNPSADAWIPILYHVMKTTMNNIDFMYNELLGLQSLEYSNLDALRMYSIYKQRIENLYSTLSDITVLQIEERPIYTIFYNIVKYYNTSFTSTDPEQTLEEFYNIVRSEGGKQYIGNVYNQTGRTEDQEVFLNESGPQIVYENFVSKLIGRCISCQEFMIQIFQENNYLLQFSKYLENLDRQLQENPQSSELQMIEEYITRTNNQQNNQGGGSHLEIRRPLYRNAKTATSSSSNNERLQQRSRARTTFRVRKSSRKSKSRR